MATHETEGRKADALTFQPRSTQAHRLLSSASVLAMVLSGALALPGAAHGVCEDYRAAAGIDLDHDRADRDAGRRLTVPLLALWGEQGVVHRCFRPLDEWRRVAESVEGEALPCGHYIAEEAPDALLARVLPFLDRPLD